MSQPKEALDVDVDKSTSSSGFVRSQTGRVIITLIRFVVEEKSWRAEQFMHLFATVHNAASEVFHKWKCANPWSAL